MSEAQSRVVAAAGKEIDLGRAWIMIGGHTPLHLSVSVRHMDANLVFYRLACLGLFGDFSVEYFRPIGNYWGNYGGQSGVMASPLFLIGAVLAISGLAGIPD